MDQTDVAVHAGFIAAPISAVAFTKLTSWSAWLTVPFGLLIGFVVTVVTVYIAIEIAAKVLGTDGDTNEGQ